MEKDIKNTDVIACKLELLLIRATNNRLEVAKEKRQKKEEMKEKQKAKAMVKNDAELQEEWVHLVKKRIKIILEMIQIQTNPMTNTHCNYKRECGGSYRCLK